MGLIKAVTGAAGGVLADQWKEFFYCDSLSENILAAKGQKRTGKRSSNTDGSDNVISNGSVITVNNGQCMMIVEQGEVIEVCAEPGEFIFDSAAQPTIFEGNLGDSAKKVFDEFLHRVTFGGEASTDQRVYYFNTKEIIGNKYGTPSPIPFRVVDRNVGLDIDVSLRCFGEYSYQLKNPLLFYKNVCGNVEGTYSRDKIDSQLKSELMTALQPAMAKISALGIRYSELPAHTQELADALNEVLSKKWGELRGIEIVSFGVSNVSISEEDQAYIKELQRDAAFRNPNMAAAHMLGAQATALKDAAKNDAGAAVGFMGMNMAGGFAGTQSADLYKMGAAQAPAAPAQPAAGGWTCSCGHSGNTGKFCAECGKPKPESTSWTCSCGATNTGKFCSECGKPRPASDWTCSCGTVNKGKFCSNCGNPRP